MINYILSEATHHTDIAIILAGYEKCASGHRFGPSVRDYYLIHFCLSGKGKLTDRHGVHSVSAGELFVIRPGEVTVYEADTKEPWEYIWMGFIGERAKVFDTDKSVYSYPEVIEDKLVEIIKNEVTAPELHISVIYELIYRLFSCEDTSVSSTKRTERIREYIRFNYMQELSVDGLARLFGFERSYLYRLFKNRFGIGVKEYIIKVRMKKARDFLKEGYTVSETAHMVGYDDEFNFSKGFKKYFGITPSKVKATTVNSQL